MEPQRDWGEPQSSATQRWFKFVLVCEQFFCLFVFTSLRYDELEIESLQTF